MPTKVKDMVDSENGLLSRRIFADPEVYQQELQQIFARCWLFLCHETQISFPGDYFTTYMGEDPVLVVRDRSGKVNAFLNVCRHRGNRLCRADSGNAASFICAYHGWAYANDGSLQAVPNLQDAYYSELDRDQWGLVPVAQIDSYKGLVFATFDASAPPLLDYLGEMTWYLDAFFDRREGGIEVVGGIFKSVVPCNWKFPADNLAGDTYHVGWNHLSAIKTGFSQSPSAKPDYGVSKSVAPGNGHGAVVMGPNDMLEPPMPELMAYEENIRSEVRQRLGPRIDLVTPAAGTVFPNMSMLRINARLLMVWHTKGPEKTEIWLTAYADKAAPPEVKEAVRLAAIRTNGPSGTFAQDDMDNWRECTRTSKGVVAQRHPMNLQLGLGHADFDEDLMGLASHHRFSENNQRAFYSRWAQIMSAESWDAM